MQQNEPFILLFHFMQQNEPFILLTDFGQQNERFILLATRRNGHLSWTIVTSKVLIRWRL